MHCNALSLHNPVRFLCCSLQLIESSTPKHERGVSEVGDTVGHAVGDGVVHPCVVYCVTNPLTLAFTADTAFAKVANVLTLSELLNASRVSSLTSTALVTPMANEALTRETV